MLSERMGEYSKAFIHYEKALKIRKESLSPNHLDLVATYNNINIVCDHTRHKSDADLFFKLAIESEQLSLASSHSKFLK